MKLSINLFKQISIDLKREELLVEVKKEKSKLHFFANFSW